MTQASIYDATHVKIHGGQWVLIKKKYGVSPEGRLAKPSEGGFGVVTIHDETISMWDAELYGREEPEPVPVGFTQADVEDYQEIAYTGPDEDVRVCLKAACADLEWALKQITKQRMALEDIASGDRTSTVYWRGCARQSRPSGLRLVMVELKPVTILIVDADSILFPPSVSEQTRSTFRGPIEVVLKSEYDKLLSQLRMVEMHQPTALPGSERR